MVNVKVRSNGKLQEWDPQRAIILAEEGAERIGTTLTNDEKERLIETVESRIDKAAYDGVVVADVIGFIVEGALFDVRPDIARFYRGARRVIKTSSWQVEWFYDNDQPTSKPARVFFSAT